MLNWRSYRSMSRAQLVSLTGGPQRVAKRSAFTISSCRKTDFIANVVRYSGKPPYLFHLLCLLMTFLDGLFLGVCRISNSPSPADSFRRLPIFTLRQTVALLCRSLLVPVTWANGGYCRSSWDGCSESAGTTEFGTTRRPATDRLFFIVSSLILPTNLSFSLSLFGNVAQLGNSVGFLAGLGDVLQLILGMCGLINLKMTLTVLL